MFEFRFRSQKAEFLHPVRRVLPKHFLHFPSLRGSKLEAPCQPEETFLLVVPGKQVAGPLQRQVRGMFLGLAAMPLRLLQGRAQVGGGPGVVDGKGNGNRDGRDQRQPGRGAGRRQRRVAPAPAPQPFRLADGTGLNGLAAESALQVVGQFLRRAVALLWRLLQAFQADGLQVAVHVRVEGVRRFRVALHDLEERFQVCGALEGRPAGKHLIEDGAEAVDVNGGGQSLAGSGLLGGHVFRRAHQRPGLGQPGVVLEPSRQPEVGDVGLALLVDQDVGWLEVAVQQPVLVGVVDGQGCLPQQSGRGARRQRSIWLARLPFSTYFMLKYGRPPYSPTS